MRSKFYLSLFLLIANITMLSAQPENTAIGQLSFQSPNTAALGEYADVPVSYYTGVPNISIPLCEVRTGSVSLPISMSYHASGVIASATSSWVGLGWSLNAGGMVSRTTQGLPDEKFNEGYFDNGADLNLDRCNPDNSVNTNSDFTGIREGFTDGEPDIFSFNIAGYTGKFYLNSNNEVVLIPQQDLQIDYVMAATGVGIETERLSAFIITPPDGTRYHFGTIAEDNFRAVERSGTPDDAYFPSAWYLRKVQSYDGNYKIILNYEEEKYAVKYRRPKTSPERAPGGPTSPPVTSQLTTTQFFGMRLTQISTPTDTVDFIPASSNRLDLDPNWLNEFDAKSLQSIEHQSGDYCKKWTFTQDYFEDTSSGQGNSTEDFRLRLTELQQSACDNSILIPPYRFSYIGSDEGETAFLPNRYTKAIDHWGYYNGATANDNNVNELNIPRVRDTFRVQSDNGASIFPAFDPNSPNQDVIQVDNVTLDYVYASGGAADRTPDAASMAIGTLDTIFYPTGGYHAYTYEPHDYFGLDEFERAENFYERPCGDFNVSSGSLQLSALEISGSSTELESCYDGVGCPSDETPTEIRLISQTDTLLASFNQETNDCLTSGGSLMTLFPDIEADTLYQVNMTTLDMNGNTINSPNVKWTVSYPANTSASNTLVGGLRIQKIQIHDGLDANRDIIRTYEYTELGDPNQSSGRLYQPPVYSFARAFASDGLGCERPLEGAVAFEDYFFESSALALSSFEGIVLGYARVVEHQNGNGRKEMIFYTEQPSPFAMLPADNFTLFDVDNNKSYPFPIAPEPARVDAGNIFQSTIYRENGQVVQDQVNNKQQDLYQFSNDKMIKVVSFNGFGAIYNSYQIRTRPYRLECMRNTLDGVTTETFYQYDPTNRFLFPIQECTANSDGVNYCTDYEYVFDRTSEAAYQEMVDRNIIATPYRTTLKAIENGNTTLLSGSRQDFAFFDANGQPQGNTNSAGADPYLESVHSYKLTFDEQGNPSTGYWEAEAEINEYYADGQALRSGYPKIMQTVDWAFKDTLDWHYGILKSRSYGDHRQSSTFHPNTLLRASITAIDGQPIFFNYDQLMRRDTMLARPKTATPNPSQTGDFNVATTFDYYYEPNGELGAYVSTRTDYAPDPTGNSQFQFTESFAYVDGLGRLIQSVEREHSADNQRDVVVTQEWDNQNRIERIYEPFESNNTTGAYVPNVPSPANQAYTETRYFNSPLNRVRGTKPPQWFETLMDYESNAANEVQNLNTQQFYAAGELNKQIASDPDDKRIITFTDKRGRVVMTKRDSIGSANFTETYNLYDLKDRPTKVIPPAATINDGNLIFSKLYSEDDQLIMQKIPDKDSIYMQYDERELLTAMQDGVMRDSSRWVVNTLDDYGRVTQTGFFQDANNHPDNNNPIINNGLLTETFYDGGFGIDPQNEPIYYGRVRKTRTSILDGYLPTNDFIESTLTYDNFGRLTNSTGNNHISLTNGSEQISMQYDFADNMVTSSHTQMVYAATTMVQERMTYDHKGRQIDAFHQVNANAEEHCSNLEYTARDLVKTRNLGGLGLGNFLQEVNYFYNGQRWLMRINDVLPFSLPAESATSDDLFYMRLNYNLADNDVNAPSQRTGNIAKITWQTLGENKLNLYGFQYDFLDRITQSTYAREDGNSKDVTNDFDTNYDYDKRGNITKLTRKGTYDDLVQTIDSLSYSYFSNSNQIFQIEDDASCPIRIVEDENRHQSIDYRASECVTFKAGFSFSGVEDGVMTAKINCSQSTKFTKGFYDRNDLQIYTYDINGNLVFDPDKQISIKYNHLNMPYEVNWSDNDNKIEWLYSADGTKLQKLVTRSIDTLSKKDYIGELEYERDTLEAIYHSEGRVIPNGLEWEYSYLLKDHLGNTRVVFKDDGTGETEVISTSAYYPFGQEIENFVQKSSPVYSYLYNGKELDSDFGLNYYHYGKRIFDPIQCRFIHVDPISDEFASLSPFNYASNNPILNIDLHGLQGLSVNDKVEGEDGKIYVVVSVEVGEGLEDRLLNGSSYEPIMPLPPTGLIPVTSTAGLVAADAIQITDLATDVVNPAKGLLKGGFKNVVKNILKFAKKKGYSKKEARKKAKEIRDQQPASEDYARHKAKQLEKKKGKDARRKAHDKKEKGAPDRTKKELDDDYDPDNG